MGTRVNYHIGTLPSAILFSNSSHNTEVPEEVFREEVKKHGCRAGALVSALLSRVYEEDGGAHKAGDRMFWLDLKPADREFVLVVDYDTVDGLPTVFKKSKNTQPMATA